MFFYPLENTFNSPKIDKEMFKKKIITDFPHLVEPIEEIYLNAGLSIEGF
tara:strand:+ start:638 stop:787 length:150 start_codon:yes stop_codon:yes gene_type:complete